MNGIGPFSLCGSRLDSGACCHTEVQERRARLWVESLEVSLGRFMGRRLTLVYSVPLLGELWNGFRSVMITRSRDGFVAGVRVRGYSYPMEPGWGLVVWLIGTFARGGSMRLGRTTAGDLVLAGLLPIPRRCLQSIQW